MSTSSQPLTSDTNPTSSRRHSGRPDNDQTRKAQNILRGEHVLPQEILKLAKQLQKDNVFGLARRILALARKDPAINDHKQLRVEIIQKQALCTYKDPDLLTDDKLTRALAILKETCEDLAETHNQETLGLAGAIFKRRWEVDGQKQHLERSLAFYYRGYREGIEKDYGYTAINAAYVLDLLAYQELEEAKKAGADSKNAEARLEEAARIRREILSKLPSLLKDPQMKWLEQEWWYYATVAEAHFGLGTYEDARSLLNQAHKLNVASWERETTSRQLTSIARLHEGRTDLNQLQASKAWDVLRDFLDNSENAVRTAFRGKVGLALSGGGFRASLFHIGVLAKLAELDMLRHVEVVSCVSGGSIIGAHYYLEVRHLLQTKKDQDITREHYIKIVQRIEKDFLAGVQRNIRTRVAAEWITNLKMIFLPNYSRTQRVGELYEEEIFSRVKDRKDGKEHVPRWLNQLFIQPLNGPANFEPKKHNWQRSAKVPILILNATTLNTGHNWQFTTSWMGEPPTGINPEIDANDRLRRMYYEDAPNPHKNIRLGHAVAASSCVPGLFEPLALNGLYPDRIVRLVDGGVYDNQGVAGLLGEDCTVMLVSDASGGMGSQNKPSTGLIGVPMRSNDILQKRVREAEYRELDARRRASLLRGLLFVHPMKDLETDPVDWIECEDPYDESDEFHPSGSRKPRTIYGVRKDVQRRLAAIRTDLDSFCNQEAFALMLSAYRMTEREFQDKLAEFSTETRANGEWRFLSIAPAVDKAGHEEEHRKLMHLLDVASLQAFKVWFLSPLLKWTGFILGLAAIGGLGWLCWRWASELVLTVRWIGVIVAALAVASVIVGKIARFHKTLTIIGIGVGMALLGWVAARIHLHVFDRLYLCLGRVFPPDTPVVGFCDKLCLFLKRILLR